MTKKDKASVKFKVKIMGAAWTVRLLSEVEFLELNNACENTAAITLPAKKEIHFQYSDLRLSTVRHEVRHAFTSELCIESADLSADQMEEVQCTLDENRFEDMDQTARNIYKKIIKK